MKLTTNNPGGELETGGVISKVFGNVGPLGSERTEENESAFTINDLSDESMKSTTDNPGPGEDSGGVNPKLFVNAGPQGSEKTEENASPHTINDLSDDSMISCNTQDHIPYSLRVL